MQDSDYVILEGEVREIMAGRRDNSGVCQMAQQLLAPVRPEHWQALAAVAQSTMTCARVLTLQHILYEAAAEVRTVHTAWAPWVATANLVGIRFCDIHPATVGWFGGTASEARALITTALMQIEGLAVAPGFDCMTLRASVRVEGDFTCANGLWTVQAVLLQGPWIQWLLTGALPLTAGAYAVPAQHSTYVEVALDAKTGSVLKTLGQLLGLDGELLRGMIRQALTLELGQKWSGWGSRVTTAAFTPGTEGKKGMTVFFSPDHADARIMIGVEATHLLQVSRRGPVLRLSLGSPPGLPVTLEMPCPEAPEYALAAMRKVPDGSAVRFLPSGASPTTRNIILGYVGPGVDLYQTGGHLPAGWLSDRLVNSAADNAWTLQLLRNLFRSQVHASSA